MKFSSPLIEGRLIRRYKRFFAEVELNGQIEIAHIPNTGSLLSCMTPGCLVGCVKSDSPTRKLKWTLEIAEADEGGWVGVNPLNANRLVAEAWASQAIPQWSSFNVLKTEVKTEPGTRIDFVLDDSHFVEVKSVSYAIDGIALFPDCVSARALKHVKWLERQIKESRSAELVFVVQRQDAKKMKAASTLDPKYAEALSKAICSGLKVSVWPVEISMSGIELKPAQSLKFVTQ